MLDPLIPVEAGTKKIFFRWTKKQGVEERGVIVKEHGVEPPELAVLLVLTFKIVELAPGLVVIEYDRHQVWKLIMQAHRVDAEIRMAPRRDLHLQILKTLLTEIYQLLERPPIIHSEAILK